PPLSSLLPYTTLFRSTLLDPSGHGTFVAGLIAAHGRTFSGVAPDAKLVSLRVLDQNGKGTMHAVLAAFDWLLRNRAAMTACMVPDRKSTRLNSSHVAI